MKKITVFETNDGTLFRNKKNALKYEELIIKIGKLTEYFPQRPEDNEDFIEGKLHIQHNPTVFEHAKQKLLNICAQIGSDHALAWLNDDEDIKGYDESSLRIFIAYDLENIIEEKKQYLPVGLAWLRICYTDYKYREWYDEICMDIGCGNEEDILYMN